MSRYVLAGSKGCWVDRGTVHSLKDFALDPREAGWKGSRKVTVEDEERGGSNVGSETELRGDSVEIDI